MDTLPSALDRDCRQETLLSLPPLTVSTIDCAGRYGDWFESPIPAYSSVVVVRAGLLDRRVHGVVSTLDATQVYQRQPGEREQVRSRGPDGYRCTVITTDPSVVPRLWPTTAGLVAPHWRSTPGADLAHRRLLAACRELGGAASLRIQACDVVDELTGGWADPAVIARRPRPTERAQHIVDGVRQVVAMPGAPTPLTKLAAHLEITPNYLSTIFRLNTGLTITRYRARLRVRLFLEWLADGHTDLSRIAYELGFADHAHFSRTVMTELGIQPREARRLLSPPAVRHRSAAANNPRNTVAAQR